jgi:hypothetical protein
MSCYIRHMKEILDEAGITVSPANKKQIDQAFHQIAGTGYKDCSATWKVLKQNYLSDENKRQELIRKLQTTVHHRTG